MLKRKSFSRRNLNLRLDQIDSRHQFGYRMLNLNPRIDLDKVKIVIRINDKLDRARIEILAFLIIRTAASHIAFRVSCEIVGDGDSSINF